MSFCRRDNWYNNFPDNELDNLYALNAHKLNDLLHLLKPKDFRSKLCILFKVHLSRIHAYLSFKYLCNIRIRRNERNFLCLHFCRGGIFNNAKFSFFYNHHQINYKHYKNIRQIKLNNFDNFIMVFKFDDNNYNVLIWLYIYQINVLNINLFNYYI